MDEAPAAQQPSPASPARPGETLKAARDAQGLSLAEIAARTRVPQRHLEALEAADYAALPSPTYAVGFARAYARAVNADEVGIAQAVRADLDRIGPRTPEYVPYETADPARVPSRGVAIVALGLALAVLILVGLWYGTTLFQRGGTTVAATDAPPVVVAPVPTVRPTPAAPMGDQVSFVAKDDVWLRVYDADNKTLYLGTLKPGEKYDVPVDANDPMINVGRPDQLAVTLNGSAVPALGTGERAIKDVKVSGAAIAARLAGGSTPSAAPTDTATPRAAPSSRRTTSTRASGAERPRLSETQRANLDAARDLPGGNSTAP